MDNIVGTGLNEVRNATADARTFEVSVCICTFARPHVRNSIESVINQINLGTTPYEIVIVDDDPAFSAAEIIRELAREHDVPIRYVECGSQNIAVARNACVDAARGDWIAFLDDDELASPEWLSSLLTARDEFDADVVKGAVTAVYPNGTANWVKVGDPYSRDYGPCGQVPSRMATGNVLIRRAVFDETQQRFDPDFGVTGGEDSEFFKRMRHKGVRIVSSRKAIVEEIVPIERVTTRYIARRARRLGQLSARMTRAHEKKGRLIKTSANEMLFLLAGVFHPVMRLFSDQLSFKAFSKLWYSVGFLEGALFGRIDERD